MKNRILIPIILSFVTSFSLKATTWTTASEGYWNDSLVWSGHVVPPIFSADTFHIRHCIIIENNLVLNTGAHVVIDSAGGICGHYTVTFNANVEVDKYGILELDTVNVVSAQVNCYGPGQVILTYYAVITGAGGSFYVDGCSMAVGPWFYCIEPAYSFASGIAEADENATFDLFPNPNNGSFVLSLYNHYSNERLTIIDLTGRIVFSELIADNKEQYTYTIKASPGMYILTLTDGQGITSTGKMVIE